METRIVVILNLHRRPIKGLPHTLRLTSWRAKAALPIILAEMAAEKTAQTPANG